MLEVIKNLPNSPGIYQYFDKNKKLLYIGKAKNLKNRVKSYWRFTPSLHPNPNLSPRIYKMISEAVEIRYIVVESENDALILENSLIKQLKPKYNILLRDDKTYPYIYIDLDEKFPRFEITRKVIKGNIKYFGPFSTGARELLDTIYENIALVQSKSCIKGNKACMFHQLKKCLAPCEGKITPYEYSKLVDEAIDLILHKDKVISLLEEKMIFYANNLNFEEAKIYRDRIKAIKSAELFSNVDIAKLEDLDVFYVYINDKKAIIIRLFIRKGKVISSDNSTINLQNNDINEVYKRVILDFYSTQTPLTSNKILVAEDFEDRKLLNEILSDKFKKNISIITPTTKTRKKLIDICKLNASEVLKTTPKTDIYQELQNYFNLSNTPYSIEIFDTSHMQAQANVGAKVVYRDKFIKEEYRHYNLETKDEYSQMRELLTKRAMSFDKLSPPDLWLIDGGQAQIKIAKEVVDSVGVDIDILGIAKEKIDAKAHRAKGGANDKIYSFDGVYKLNKDNKLLQFLQKLRDEAHRFAISFHRKQKLKQDKEIELLQIKGIGKAKIKRLLDYFGSFENIKKANFEELNKIIDKTTAKNIVEHYHRT
ncbi:MAG: excinuclease ABC subunit UvrC [Epsilonproteobacteria bacterium]|nr:excinuclease ABC subunit UvrC [Campylobacterota bacterium]